MYAEPEKYLGRISCHTDLSRFWLASSSFDQDVEPQSRKQSELGCVAHGPWAMSQSVGGLPRVGSSNTAPALESRRPSNLDDS